MSSSHPPPKGLAGACVDCEDATIARVVAWLRDEHVYGTIDLRLRVSIDDLDALADAIERGEWKR